MNDGSTAIHMTMCDMDNLRIARKPLESLPGDLKFIWVDIKVTGNSLHVEIFVSNKLFLSPQGKQL